ncbi:hypothetical protein GCM10010112_24340 [Actinoplanes lobatus]|uniref:Uncharacterized protein n=1 Tax=Actinoplanes lobatus TaxID=113568 RepID=A0A7W7HJ48_9ACTN|nr:hypothetical protein [Actinoplanes lobatus]MBB4751476.1 hypothetical protein [Actinoplanes lobatus]GGN64285.1 hypothetical protein GCM10010112_24340 [Actinoplanes lobatus]GIE41085.1 hypothetical protein Alo02nite_39830 [Actinoplanes lobatus]
MSTFADIPKAIRASIVVMDPGGAAPRRVIVMQFNPDSLERSIQPQAAGGTSGASGTGTDGDRNEALRLKGPAEEQWKFTAEIDATDQLDVAAPDGIHPQLAALEMLVQPTVAQLRESIDAARRGAIEVNPIEMPLTLFTWGGKRIMPVRLTELSVNEQAFDVDLNPIRASLSIGMKILTVSDLPFGHPGGDFYLAHLAMKEQLAARGSRIGG